MVTLKKCKTFLRSHFWHAFKEAVINAFRHNIWVDGNEPMDSINLTKGTTTRAYLFPGTNKIISDKYIYAFIVYKYKIDLNAKKILYFPSTKNS